MIEKNLYKVEEAKKKVCAILSQKMANVAEFLPCLADNCMHWHWQWHNANDQKGYCGLKGELK